MSTLFFEMRRRLEPFTARLNQFCFSSGETIRAEGDEGDVVHRPKAPDKAGVRQAETRRAKPAPAEWFNLAMKCSRRQLC